MFVLPLRTSLKKKERRRKRIEHVPNSPFLWRGGTAGGGGGELGTVAAAGAAAATGERLKVSLGCQGHGSPAKCWVRDGDRRLEGAREEDTEALPSCDGRWADTGYEMGGDGGGPRRGER